MQLIAESLKNGDLTPHILEDGSLEEHSDTEGRLLKLHGLDQEDIFRSEKERFEAVYDRMCEEITFTPLEDHCSSNGVNIRQVFFKDGSYCQL